MSLCCVDSSYFSQLLIFSSFSFLPFIDDASPKKKTAQDQLFGEFLTTTAPIKTIREKAKDKILKYRERDCLDLGGDVLQWWKKQVDLPLLSALAKSYLSIPATSVSSERVFSTAGDIVTAKRSLRHPDHVDQLIFLKKKLKKKHLG